MNETNRLELETRAYTAMVNFRDSEPFPSLSSFEHAAFEHWFVEGFLDAAQHHTPKADWSGELERKPGADFNRDAYKAGYAEGVA